MTFPTAIDSSMVSTFRSCPQKFHREYEQHWKIASPNVHLHAGGAYASALEVARKAFYDEKLPKAEAEAVGMQKLFEAYGTFEAPEGSKKSLGRIAGALEFYFSEYPFGEDISTPYVLPNGQGAIEFTFAIPLPINHPDTGEPLLYCGRTDMIVEWAGGVYVLDDKTTSTLGPSWGRQWELRSQFTGYTWAARQVGIPVQGIIIRGLSILSNRYETQQVITPRSPFLIERWYGQLLKDVQRMVDSYKKNEYDFNLDHACNDFGGCSFVKVCGSPNPEEWLSIYFEKRIWNPIERLEKEEEIK